MLFNSFLLNFFRFTLVSILLFFTNNVLSQSNVASQSASTNHFIAPASWSYFSNANEIVVSTESSLPNNVSILSSNGSLITSFVCVSGSPVSYRFLGSPCTVPQQAFGVVLNGQGLRVVADFPVLVTVRNIASDATGCDSNIKGNSALSSFGSSARGLAFHLGYYRPISFWASVMAIHDNTSISINGNFLVTLNAGQSFIINNPGMGALLQSSSEVVVNTGRNIDQPLDACGDSVFSQVVPNNVLGTDYIFVRTQGNSEAEKTTVIASQVNTSVTISTFSPTGAPITSTTVSLPNIGSSITINNGDGSNAFSSTFIQATNPVILYVGSGVSCEVDQSVVGPVGGCSGSSYIETKRFIDYGGNPLPYFGFITIESPTETVYVNGIDIETLSGPRKALGTTGFYLLNFTNVQIGNPNDIQLSSSVNLNVNFIQQGGGFSSSIFFSSFTSCPSPLPIELIRFDANYVDKYVELVWETGAEINNDFFTIQKSVDATNWEFLKNVKAVGNSSSLINYKTRDDYPGFTGFVYYKLSQTDFDGTFTDVAIRSVLINEDNVTFYPSAFSESITVSSTNQIGDLRVYDMLGKTVYSEFTNETKRIINLSHLITGVYFLQLNNTSYKIYKI